MVAKIPEEQIQAVREPKARQLWERQRYETRKQYRAFCTFRDQLFERSLTAVAVELKVSTGYINRISRQNQWQIRVDAYDDYLDKKKRAENEKVLAEMAERHARAATRLIEKAMARIDTIDPDEIPRQSLPTYLDTAVKIERLSRGANTDHTVQEQVGKSGGPIKIESFDYNSAIAGIAPALAELTSPAPSPKPMTTEELLREATSVSGSENGGEDAE